MKKNSEFLKSIDKEASYPRNFKYLKTIPKKLTKMKNQFYKNLDKYTEKFSKKFPEIPLHDLRLILFNLLKPKTWPKRFILRKLKKDVYVP